MVFPQPSENLVHMRFSLIIQDCGRDLCTAHLNTCYLACKQRIRTYTVKSYTCRSDQMKSPPLVKSARIWAFLHGWTSTSAQMPPSSQTSWGSVTNAFIQVFRSGSVMTGRLCGFPWFRLKAWYRNNPGTSGTSSGTNSEVPIKKMRLKREPREPREPFSHSTHKKINNIYISCTYIYMAGCGLRFPRFPRFPKMRLNWYWNLSKNPSRFTEVPPGEAQEGHFRSQ